MAMLLLRAQLGKKKTENSTDTKTEGEFLGEKVDPFAEITVTEDGCLLYEYEMVLLERI